MSGSYMFFNRKLQNKVGEKFFLHMHLLSISLSHLHQVRAHTMHKWTNHSNNTLVSTQHTQSQQHCWQRQVCGSVYDPAQISRVFKDYFIHAVSTLPILSMLE